MRGLGSDLRYALHLFTRSPGFTIVAIVTVAVGIGGATAVFGLIDALLLRRLPYSAAERLVVPELTVAVRGQGPAEPMSVWSYPKYQTLLAEQNVFEDVGGYRDVEVNFASEMASERLSGELATPSYFATLGVRAALGRLYSEDDRMVAVIGHRFWKDRYAGDPSVLGRTLRVDGHTLTIIGVAPSGFRGLSATANLWMPMALAATLLHPQMLTMRWSHWFEVVARLRPGITPGQLATRMDALGAAIERAHPSPSAAQSHGATSVPLADARKDPKMRASVAILFGAVALVLLIGCVNVANLLLSRSAARRHEMAVRAALGASRGRLVRQLMTESLVLGLCAGALGILLALWGLELIAAIRPEAIESSGVSAAELRDLDSLGFSPWLALFAAGVSMAASVVFGIIPALGGSRVDLAPRIRAGGPGASPRLRGRDAFAAVEVALTVVLLVGAGLLLRTVGRLAAEDLGYRSARVLSFQIDPVRHGERGTPWLEREDLESRLAALPGVESVGFDLCAPPLGRCDITDVAEIEGRPPFPDGAGPTVEIHFVSPGQLATLGVPVVHGRGLDRRDRTGAPKVVVMNQSAERALFPAGDAIGHRLHAGYGDEGMVEIVGVVGDVSYDGPFEPPHPALYVPAQQFGPASGFVFLRTQDEPALLVPAVRAAVTAFDRNLPIYEVKTLDERKRDATARPRFAAVLLGGFAVVALLLSAVGVYGVMAALVAQRRREIGIRMALGARAGDVMMRVFWRGAAIAASGVVLGAVLALAVARVLAGLVFGVAVTDPATYALVAGLLLAVAGFASLAAGRRALAIQPVEALRAE